MSDAHESAEAVITSIEKLRRNLRKVKMERVRSRDELRAVKNLCLAWFDTQRADLAVVVDEGLLGDLDFHFKAILTATDRQTSRNWYEQELKTAQSKLSALRADIIATAHLRVVPTVDTPPSFASLVGDAAMQDILNRRWNECVKCVTMGAPLAATVMMGGLLEALLLAKVNKEPNKDQVFKASLAPIDKNTGKVAQLKNWVLKNYIDVAHELGWISRSAKDVGEVMRDYRNFIHPHKEHSHKVVLNGNDAKLFWEIAKEITRQLVT